MGPGYLITQVVTRSILRLNDHPLNHIAKLLILSYKKQVCQLLIISIAKHLKHISLMKCFREFALKRLYSTKP